MSDVATKLPVATHTFTPKPEAPAKPADLPVFEREVEARIEENEDRLRSNLVTSEPRAFTRMGGVD